MNHFWSAFLLGVFITIIILKFTWLIFYCMGNGWYLGKLRAIRKVEKEKKSG